MALEIERRYVVKNTDWQTAVTGQQRIRQGFLAVSVEKVVRVRISGDQAWLTVKGMVSASTRREFEYAIPHSDANEMLDHLCPQVMEKTRYHVMVDGKHWEVDVFEGVNAGLVLAEIELTSETDTFVLPSWLGHEVTEDGRYTNAYLSQHPYTSWTLHP